MRRKRHGQRRFIVWGFALLAAFSGLMLIRGALIGVGAPSYEKPEVILNHTAAEHLAAAIQIPTISHDTKINSEVSDFTAFHQFLEKTYPNIHGVFRRTIMQSGSVMYHWPAATVSVSKGGPVGFLAHMDVVPVESQSVKDWAYPPFGGVIADGIIHGRGAADDKGHLIALMEAAENLIKQGFIPQRDLYFLFGHDEEIGGSGAVEMAGLLQGQGVTLDWVLDEGSAVIAGIVPGLDRPAALISLAEKGSVTVELTAYGDGGHSSTPPDETAISRLSRAVHLLTAHQYTPELSPPVSQMLAGLAPYMDFPTRIAIANQDILAPLLAPQLAAGKTMAATMRTTTAATVIEGGVKENVLPQSARALVNFRIHPRDTVESVLAHVHNTIQDDTVHVGIYDGGLGSEPSPVSDAEAEGFLALAAATKAVYGDIPIAPSLTIAATDARHYPVVSKNQYRFSPFILTGKDLERIHGTGEQLSVDNLSRGVIFFEMLFQNIAGPDH